MHKSHQRIEVGQVGKITAYRKLYKKRCKVKYSELGLAEWKTLTDFGNFYAGEVN